MYQSYILYDFMKYIEYIFVFSLFVCSLASTSYCIILALHLNTFFSWYQLCYCCLLHFECLINKLYCFFYNSVNLWCSTFPAGIRTKPLPCPHVWCVHSVCWKRFNTEKPMWKEVKHIVKTEGPSTILNKAGLKAKMVVTNTTETNMNNSWINPYKRNIQWLHVTLLMMCLSREVKDVEKCSCKRIKIISPH